MRLAMLAFLAGPALLAACGDSSPSAGAAAPATSAGAPAAAAAAAAPHGVRDPVQLSVDVQVGGAHRVASGLGECTHTADASIYSVPAEQWRASLDPEEGSSLRHLSLTLWQPKAGGAMQVNLSLQGEGGDRSIATVQGGAVVGSATASAGMDGSAGVLTVQGREGEGVPMEVTVRCERVTVPVAEGG